MQDFNPKDSSELTYRDKLMRLRALSHSFDPGDGFDLRKIENWSPATKRKITNAYKQVDEMIYSIHKVYRPRKRKNLKIVAKEFWNRDKIPDWLTAIPIQVTAPNLPSRIKISKSGRVRLQEKMPSGEIFTSEHVYFDIEKLIKEPEKEVNETLSRFPDDALFAIITGDHVSTMGGNKINTELRVLNLMKTYSAGNYNPNKPSSRYFGNWLFGLRYMGNGPHERFQKYASVKAKYKEQRRRKRMRAKSKLQRERGKLRERKVITELLDKYQKGTLPKKYVAIIEAYFKLMKK